VVPAFGRLPAAGDPAAPQLAVISHGLWQRAFGSAPDVLGRTIDIGIHTFEVVGVTPRGFVGIDADPTDVWLPLETRGDRRLYPGWRKRNDSHLPHVIARLHDEVTAASAGARIAALLEPIQLPERSGLVVVLGDMLPARAPTLSADTRVVVWTGVMSLLLLLVACGNAGNLLLVRRLRRAHDVAIKVAVGASRARLLREVVLDAALIALLAGTSALALVVVVGPVIRQVFLPGLAIDVSSLDARLVRLTVLVTLIAAFVLTIIPALRQTTQDVTRRGIAARVTRPSRVLDVFVGLQVALSLPLILASGLFLASLWNARASDFGMHATNVVIVETNTAEIGRPHDAHQVHRAIEERLRAMPAIAAVSVSQSAPTEGRFGFRVHAQGRPAESWLTAQFTAVDPDYFDVVRLRVLDGRALAPADNLPGSHPVVTISESLARDLWPGQSAVGQCLDIVGPKLPCAAVVGVFADVAHRPTLTWRASTDVVRAVLAPLGTYGATSSGRVVLARTHGDPTAMLGHIRREAQTAAENLPHVDVRALDDVFEPMMRPWRLGSSVFVSYGVLTLLIAAAGLVVVTTYAVSGRQRELGIRSAVGAEPRDLTMLILGQQTMAVGGGLLAGLVLASMGGRWIESLLYGVSPHGPRLVAAVTVLLLAVAVVAAWLPARRAGRVEPAAVLRAE
jgi:putative ABC transport system permease protein